MRITHMTVILEQLREIESNFGYCRGKLNFYKDNDELEFIRLSDLMILYFLVWVFHKFLLRIQNHAVEDEVV